METKQDAGQKGPSAFSILKPWSGKPLEEIGLATSKDGLTRGGKELREKWEK